MCHCRQTNKTTKIKSWQEKGTPKTTKQTVTLTTVAGQKVQEKSLNGTTGCIQRRTFWESPLRLYYDNHTGYTTDTTTSWLQTNQNSTTVTSTWVRWLDWRWFVFKVFVLFPYCAGTGSAIAQVGPRDWSGMYRSHGLSQPMGSRISSDGVRRETS